MKTILILLLTLSLNAFTQEANTRDCFKIDTKIREGVVIQQFKQIYQPVAYNYRRSDGSISLRGVGGGSIPKTKHIEVNGGKYFVFHNSTISHLRKDFKFEAFYKITDKTVKYQGKTLKVVKVVRVGKYIPKNPH